MGRRPQHDSGRKIHVGVRLPPEHVEALDEFARRRNLNRSQAVEDLIRRGIIARREAAPDDAPQLMICDHPAPYDIIGGGLRRCRKCGITSNLRGEFPQ